MPDAPAGPGPGPPADADRGEHPRTTGGGPRHAMARRGRRPGGEPAPHRRQETASRTPRPAGRAGLLRTVMTPPSSRGTMTGSALAPALRSFAPGLYPPPPNPNPPPPHRPTPPP